MSKREGNREEEEISRSSNGDQKTMENIGKGRANCSRSIGTIGNARSDLETLGIKDGTDMIQTAALLGSAHILRKTMSL